MALKDGIMRCNGNLGGLTSLLKPYIKHMIQLLDALSALRCYCCCCCCWWWWWRWPASCLLLAHCCLPPAALLLLQHPFAMKKRTCRTGKHHGTEGRNNALQSQSRRPNVPSGTLHKTYVSALRCSRPASCLLPAHCCLPPAAFLLLQHPFAMKKCTCRTGKHHGTEGRNNALQWQSRRPNVPSETLHKTYVPGLRCSFSS